MIGSAGKPLRGGNLAEEDSPLDLDAIATNGRESFRPRDAAHTSAAEDYKVFTKREECFAVRKLKWNSAITRRVTLRRQLPAYLMGW
jgi:hypothetical protein